VFQTFLPEKKEKVKFITITDFGKLEKGVGKEK